MSEGLTNSIGLIFVVALSVAVGYFAVRVLRGSELRALVSSLLRGFLVGAFICGCIGGAVIIRNELIHGEDLVSVFKDVIFSGSIAAFFGGVGGVMAVRNHLKRETEKGE